jgi:electron transport complex protein RnfG
VNEIVRITVKLTVSCIIAASIMGTAFVFTDQLKRQNERLHEREVMLQLLGYDKANPPPDGLALRWVYRYILGTGDAKQLGYLVPLKQGAGHPYQLMVLNLDGSFAAGYGLSLPEDKVYLEDERAAALQAVLKSGTPVTYADESIVVERDGQRRAFLLPGKFPGFKTFIRIMLALKPDFTIIGFQVLEQEEDPGLGAEIEKDYFRNQFRGKTFAKLKELKVIKVPLSDEYRKYLVDENEQVRPELNDKYRNEDIHALTGATISSDAVTRGIQAMVTKFAYRLKVLDRAIKEQDIPAAL